MKRPDLFAIPALVLAMSAGPALPQQDVDNRSAGDLQLTVTLEELQSRIPEHTIDRGATTMVATDYPERWYLIDDSIAVSFDPSAHSIIVHPPLS